MQTSAQGIAALELEEGVVLRAYRDAVGVWTIGAGLTAASGVITPKAGMVISGAEATTLLQRALREKYEPTVEVAMSVTSDASVARPKQHEFDAGVSFHWNTGAIRKATWVAAWKARASRHDIFTRLAAWNKGGGRVLPGLVARRKREAEMLLDGVYRRPQPVDPAPKQIARWGVALSGAEIDAVREGFRQLGYWPGMVPNGVDLAAARKFQADHGLTVDGIIGRATLSTLQRRLDAAAKAVPALGAPVVAATASATGSMDTLTGLPGSDAVLLASALIYAARVAWTYRDAVAAKINTQLPRAAAFLRSF